MIVLITGASHTGKTTLAQHLLEKYKYPYLSYWSFRDGDEPYWLQKAYIWRMMINLRTVCGRLYEKWLKLRLRISRI